MVTLKQLRKARGISQTDLAMMLQETRGGKGFQGPISAIESGRNSPTVKRLTDILAALGYELRLSVKAKGEPTMILDLASLLGQLPRAKDAPGRIEETLPDIPPDPEPRSLESVPEAAMTDPDDPVASLILSILNK
ncbi:MAG: XRE family transcriptional regulator [Proteobacteria bacterium]|nr:XRE family transcriptional regulator [Pseudomonadota bacterium]